MSENKQSLEAIKFQRGKAMLVLDQLKLPHEHCYVQVTNCEQAASVIKKMQVRGAPAIALTALLGVATELMLEEKQGGKQDLKDFIRLALDNLIMSRPTAVNLRNEADQLWKKTEELTKEENIDFITMKQDIVAHCEKAFQRDLEDNLAIGRHGSQYILQHSRPDEQGKVTILTHCNTGTLATGGYGTALGVIRALHTQGQLSRAYYTETRPYNQGSRLTAYELKYETIPATLICDSAVSALMSAKGVSAVVVGADRIACNGDTANKIGTLQLAIVAQHFNVPFFVAASTCTIDLTCSTGAEIPIEDRPEQELAACPCPEKNRIPPEGIQCWNPAFDVTPFNLITGGFITQYGVIKPPFNSKETMALLGLQ